MDKISKFSNYNRIYYYNMEWQGWQIICCCRLCQVIALVFSVFPYFMGNLWSIGYKYAGMRCACYAHPYRCVLIVAKAPMQVNFSMKHGNTEPERIATAQ